jgi:hypothetical protein
MTAPKTKTAPKSPQDRLGKLPRRVTVGIYLDDTTVAAVDAAERDLTAARERLDASRPRRLAEFRSTAEAVDVIDPEAIRAKVATSERPELEPLERAATEALDAMDAATLWFTFRSLGRTPFSELLAKHPARDEDHEAMSAQSEGAKAPYNMDTFPSALVQAACVDPVLTDDDIATIFEGDAWNDVEINALVVHAQLAQAQAPVADPKRRRA